MKAMKNPFLCFRQNINPKMWLTYMSIYKQLM